MLLAATIGALALAAQSPDGLRVARNQAPTLLLTAAGQDGEVFLTWSPLPGATYLVRWRVSGAREWQTADAGTTPRRSMTSLANAVPHEFQVQASSGETSAVVPSTPRPRPSCETIGYVPPPPHVDFFCTKAALDRHLAARGIDPLSLRCRQQPVAAWTDDSPNCHYVTPDGDYKLLLRTADSTFVGGMAYPDPSVVRDHARRAIWAHGDPFGEASGRTPALTAIDRPIVGQVTGHSSARTFQTTTAGGPLSTLTWFEPRKAVAGRFAIYHEGHGGAAVEIGAETIDWLLARGWTVVALDMPLLGGNRSSARPGLQGHADFDALDTGSVSPIEQFLLPVKAVVDAIATTAGRRDPDILLIGRSGGGWATYVYGAIDPRIDVAVSVAGGRPIPTRLDAPWGAAELGDYEQAAPHLYDAVPHEALMLAAGARGSFHVFNRWDTCCFRVQPGDSFVRYLRRGGVVMHKPVGVFVDPDHRGHSMSARAYAELARFLRGVLP